MRLDLECGDASPLLERGDMSPGCQSADMSAHSKGSPQDEVRPTGGQDAYVPSALEIMLGR